MFTDLSSRYPTIAIWLAEEPAQMLPIFNVVAHDLVGEVYPDYHKNFASIFVRIKDLPVEDKLRDLRQVHLNALIKIRGVVTKRTGVFPELKESWYKCYNCGSLKGPMFSNSDEENRLHIGSCITCQTQKQWHLEDQKCIYRNYQKWTI